MKKGKPRIFVGINEITDFTLNLSRGIRELGFPVTNAVLEPNTPVVETGVRPDRYIKRGGNKYSHFIHRTAEFIRAAPSHDIFVFIFAESFLPSALLTSGSAAVRWLAYRDLPLLRAMGKKIVIVANGCDVRHYSATEKQAREDGFKYHVCIDCDHRDSCSLALNSKKVEIVERYADSIFTNPVVGVLFKRRFFNILPPIDLSTVSYTFNATDNPLVIHAPTNRSRKGTKYIIEAAERLEKEGHRFRFFLCENMTSKETRKTLGESEIVVDQLLSRGQGLFAVEAMASGNAVLNHATPGLYGYTADLPVVTSDPDTVYENLKMVLEDTGLREERARRGRAYVEKYHDHVAVAGKMLAEMGVLP